jgi:hypothetical protein
MKFMTLRRIERLVSKVQGELSTLDGETTAAGPEGKAN